MEQVNLVERIKLKEENEELKTVLNKLSHEMGNALTLLGASIYYVEINIIKANAKCDISDLKNDYTYICNLFKELREYNQTDSITKKEITIEEMKSCIESSYNKLLGNDNVKLSVFVENSILTKKLFADIVMLKQAFINILKNSIEAVEKNDEQKGKKINVRISVSNNWGIVEEEMLEMEEKGIDSEVRSGVVEVIHIEIADNGIGISEKNMEKIFLPLFTYGKKDGTGWGLSIVKKIVEKHKGKVKAVSDQRTGTAIHIYLPILN